MILKTAHLFIDPTKRHEFVLLFDVKDGNPNGNPDAGNLPRIDPETGHGIVTDVSVKRKIRDYVARELEKPIFIQSEYALNSLIVGAARGKGIEPPGSPVEDEELLNWLKINSIDGLEFDGKEATFEGEFNKKSFNNELQDRYKNQCKDQELDKKLKEVGTALKNTGLFKSDDEALLDVLESQIFLKIDDNGVTLKEGIALNEFDEKKIQTSPKKCWQKSVILSIAWQKARRLSLTRTIGNRCGSK